MGTPRTGKCSCLLAAMNRASHLFPQGSLLCSSSFGGLGPRLLAPRGGSTCTSRNAAWQGPNLAFRQPSPEYNKKRGASERLAMPFPSRPWGRWQRRSCYCSPA